MNVRDLIERLEDEDPNAEVRMMCQQQWPFEYSIYGICSSSQLVEEDESEEEDEEELPHDHMLVDRHPGTGITEKPKCVFLVEGSQLSYGNKNAWEVAR